MKQILIIALMLFALYEFFSAAAHADWMVLFLSGVMLICCAFWLFSERRREY